MDHRRNLGQSISQVASWAAAQGVDPENRQKRRLKCAGGQATKNDGLSYEALQQYTVYTGELVIPSSRHFTDYLILPPMALAQCAIAWVVLRHAWQRYSRWITGLIALGFAVLGAILLVGALSEFARFAFPLAAVFGWRNVDLAKIVTFLWCFSSTPAVALYFLARFAASRVSPVHQPERRKLIVNAGKVAVAAPFIIAGYGATVGRINFKVQEIEIPVRESSAGSRRASASSN